MRIKQKRSRLAAVNGYGNALQYVKKQTPEICLAAVNGYGNALQYVKSRLRKSV
ncbi:MAG: DUF4116 domain-containing protein [Blautia sp.]